MADKKISELPLLNAVSGSNLLIPLVHDGTTSRIYLSQLGHYASQWSAKTGSANTFTGNQTINGNLVVSGDLKAERYYIETISSSVIYESGSTTWGNSADDTHTFTGSIILNGAAIGGAEINSFTASQLAVNTGISSVTSSLNNFSGSTNQFTRSIELATASLQYFYSFTSSQLDVNTRNSIVTASLNNFTGSTNAFTGAIERTTASIHLATASFNYLYQSTASIQAFTASQADRNLVLSTVTGSINQATQSLQSFTSSQADRNLVLSTVTGSLNNFTSSQDSRNFVISQYTSSTDAHIVGISAFTSSQLAVNFGISQITASLIGITNTLMGFTASLDNTYATDAQLYQLYQATRSIELHSGSMIGITNGLMAYTSSNETWKTGVRGEINGIESYTASLKAQTIVSNSAQLPEIGGIEAYTASLKAAAIVSSSTQVVNYNLFALTASANTFYGTQSVTGSVRISGSIDDISYIDFDTVAPATAVARLGWDDSEGTLTIGLSGGNVNIPIGVTNFETAYNADSSSISKGDVVRVSGAQGNRVAIQKANNLNDDGSATTVALAAETIGVGAQGKVILSGPLKGIDTTAFAEGDLLYLSSTPGGITNIKPQAPFHEVRIGVAQRIHASVGIVNVKVDNGYELDELHNVRITTASLAHNQLLAYSGSVWRNETIDGLGIATTASLNPVLAYTASLKGAAIVSSSTQIQNYNLFAVTSSANSFYGAQSVSGSLFVTSNSGFGTSDATGSGILKVISAGTQNAFSIGQSNSKRWTGFGANDLKVYGDDYFITTVDAFPLSIGTNNTSRITIANDGGINATGAITASNFRISTAGGGIDFSATSNGSGTTTSELLNDYEEGTWTPGLSPGTSGTITVNTGSSKASYTKIGRAVHIQAYILVTSVSSPVGRLSITGLPFTSGANLGDATAAVYNNAFTGNPGGWPILRLAAGGTTAYIDIQEGDGTDPAIDLSDHITANTELTFSFTYFV